MGGERVVYKLEQPYPWICTHQVAKGICLQYHNGRQNSIKLWWLATLAVEVGPARFWSGGEIGIWGIYTPYPRGQQGTLGYYVRWALQEFAAAQLGLLSLFFCSVLSLELELLVSSKCLLGNLSWVSVFPSTYLNSTLCWIADFLWHYVRLLGRKSVLLPCVQGALRTEFLAAASEEASRGTLV